LRFVSCVQSTVWHRMSFEYLRFNIVCILYTYIMRKYMNIDKWHAFEEHWSWGSVQVANLISFTNKSCFQRKKTFSEFKIIHNAAYSLKKFILTISQIAQNVCLTIKSSILLRNFCDNIFDSLFCEFIFILKIYKFFFIKEKIL